MNSLEHTSPCSVADLTEVGFDAFIFLNTQPEVNDLGYSDEP